MDSHCRKLVTDQDREVGVYSLVGSGWGDDFDQASGSFPLKTIINAIKEPLVTSEAVNGGFRQADNNNPLVSMALISVQGIQTVSASA